MNETIKHRIEQICRGEVPKGYKKTKVGIVPEEWEEKIILHYGLSESEREALRAAIEGAKAVVRIPLSDA